MFAFIKVKQRSAYETLSCSIVQYTVVIKFSLGECHIKKLRTNIGNRALQQKQTNANKAEKNGDEL